jgi:Mor family transcriptional regulator
MLQSDRVQEPTIELKPSELADHIGVTVGYLSQAVRNDWDSKGYRIKPWSRWHRNGTKVVSYEVPITIAKEIIDKEYWDEYDLERRYREFREKYDPEELRRMKNPVDRDSFDEKAVEIAEALRTLVDVGQHVGVDDLPARELLLTAKRIEGLTR